MAHPVARRKWRARRHRGPKRSPQRAHRRKGALHRPTDLQRLALDPPNDRTGARLGPTLASHGHRRSPARRSRARLSRRIVTDRRGPTPSLMSHSDRTQAPTTGPNPAPPPSPPPTPPNSEQLRGLTTRPKTGVLPRPIGDYLDPGVHTLHFTSASGGAIWVDAICASSGAPCSSLDNRAIAAVWHPLRAEISPRTERCRVHIVGDVAQRGNVERPLWHSFVIASLNCVI